ncbi:MAG: hypothetical protein A2X36_15080 [Elusimicrobia bacterium GWA2_69_24]|nr:MAG: hypothetical protein A2X36_15080 [Elusimicrobia bacterium GWA2_69_24]HBL15344.1 hypothetical protein [Elusimicrobiota bacterium]
MAKAAVALAGAFAFRLYLAWEVPADSWDGLSYHLPIVHRWLSQGSLDLTGWSGFHRYLAMNGELLGAWLALLAGGKLEAATIAASPKRFQLLGEWDSRSMGKTALYELIPKS